MIKSPKDFWAGLMFIAFGLFFLLVALNYQMGSALSMGPAYFPTVLGGLLAVFGGIVFLQSFALRGGKVSPMSVRPIFFIVLSLLLFGYLLEPIGLVLALALLIVASAFAGHEFKLKEVAILCVALTAFAVLVFVKGLTLNVSLWPAFIF